MKFSKKAVFGNMQAELFPNISKKRQKNLINRLCKKFGEDIVVGPGCLLLFKSGVEIIKMGPRRICVVYGTPVEFPDIELYPRMYDKESGSTISRNL